MHTGYNQNNHKQSKLTQTMKTPGKIINSKKSQDKSRFNSQIKKVDTPSRDQEYLNSYHSKTNENHNSNIEPKNQSFDNSLNVSSGELVYKSYEKIDFDRLAKKLDSDFFTQPSRGQKKTNIEIEEITKTTFNTVARFKFFSDHRVNFFYIPKILEYQIKYLIIGDNYNIIVEHAHDMYVDGDVSAVYYFRGKEQWEKVIRRNIIYLLYKIILKIKLLVI